MSKPLTEEQIEEVKRRLAKPQAQRVIAYHMKIPLCQVMSVRHSMRTAGRPYTDIGGDAMNAVSVNPQRSLPE
jgi:hypothetical protein